MADPSPEEVAVTKALAAINWGGCEGYEPACVPEHCQCRQAARAAIQAYRSVRPDEHLRNALSFIAGHLTTDEGDVEDTEDEFGLDVSEVVAMAHDNMILAARRALK